MSKKCELLNKSITTGNKVSHSNRKTRRRFLPNLKSMAFYSEVLKINLNLKVATSTIRTINKYGNIDNFLINFRFNKLSTQGQLIRSKIKNKLNSINS